MGDYRKMYEEKKMAPREMMQCLKNDDIVTAPTAVCEPPILIDAMCDYVMEAELTGIKLVKNWMIPTGAKYATEEFKDKITPVSVFAGGSEVRNMIGEGRADYVPCSLYQQAEIYRRVKPRVFLALVSPMDEEGYFSASLAPLEFRTLADMADEIFIEVSPHMPNVCGDSKIHISEISGLVETDTYPPEVPESVPGTDDIKIAEYIVDRIPDGACVQFGIGKVPDAVGSLLKNKKHLGIHTELLCSSMYHLIEAGAVDNSEKNIDKGKTVFTFCGGIRELYDYVHENPAVEGRNVEYVNDPYTIAQNDNVMAINACLEVDIFGQVCSESIGPKKISGSGGQLNFVQGANMSKGGKNFIVVHSTAKNGTISTIKPMLTEGAHVTVPMNDVDHIVTEYGIAELRYKTASERVKAMINIAHPDMRDELMHHAKKIGIMI